MLLGWHFDVILGYLIRSLIHFLKFRGAADWAREKATVSSSKAEGLYGGHVAEVSYIYVRDGGYFAGTYERPFLLQSSAEDYAARFWQGSQLIIRLKPAQPQTTAILDEDQTTLKLELTTP
jgi:hypothetical protein